ncbi:MAG TPA: hypothetical protein QF641_00975 [Candidatus Thalassarchaeaceae archaeon]|nr:hypothetical protein [Candidatus Thalassarchaeaceae archaeon]
MEEERNPPVYVRKNRESYSGMVLNSMFSYLRNAIVIVVIIGILAMFGPYIF